jgi:nicotinate-nucleotide pyrophosphorylase (carboxylating)
MRNYSDDPNLEKLLSDALKEDIAGGDITTRLYIPGDKNAKAVLVAKEKLVVCGMALGERIFKMQDKNIRFKPCVCDGAIAQKGRVIARIRGKARSILTAERVVLNFLSLLSGVSTQTREFVNAVKPYKTKILDTRKTIPGLRILEKYAVRIGGGFNHRISLDEMILIKDNHLKVLGSRFRVLGKIKKTARKGIKTEIEVSNLKEFRIGLNLNPDIIMLDNMSLRDMRESVMLRNNRVSYTKDSTPKLEASGNITMKNVRKVAATGVDFISIGALTHSVKSVDISLEII